MRSSPLKFVIECYLIYFGHLSLGDTFCRCLSPRTIEGTQTTSFITSLSSGQLESGKVIVIHEFCKYQISPTRCCESPVLKQQYSSTGEGWGEHTTNSRHVTQCIWEIIKYEKRIFNVHAGRIYWSKIPCEASKAPQRHTGGISPQNIWTQLIFKKKIHTFWANEGKKKITDVKIPDLSTENTCLFGFCSSFPWKKQMW